MLEWAGALRWIVSNEPPETVRSTAKKFGGHATLFRSNEIDIDVFQTLDTPLSKIHRNLKRAFYPKGILNPDRLYKNL